MDMKVVEKILKEEDFIHFVDIALIQEVIANKRTAKGTFYA